MSELSPADADADGWRVIHWMDIWRTARVRSSREASNSSQTKMEFQIFEQFSQGDNGPEFGALGGFPNNVLAYAIREYDGWVRWDAVIQMDSQEDRFSEPEIMAQGHEALNRVCALAPVLFPEWAPQFRGCERC